jgi:cephalosporin hydroxylase
MKLKDILESTEELNTVDYIGTDKNTVHGFVDFFYEKEFENYRDKEISLLEIGVHIGGSLYLWGKYFKNGSILGIDIADKVREKWKVLANTKYIIGDAYDENIANSLKDFDIIIDDGPHTLESQVLCIEKYLPKLKKGGLLVIEDVQDISHFSTLKEATPDYFKDKIETLDLRHARGRYDDLLFIIRNT